MKILYTLAVFVLTASASFAQTITINIEVPDSVSIGTLYLRGNSQGWAIEDETTELLEDGSSNGVTTYTIDVDVADISDPENGFIYKFTDGLSWDTQYTAPGADCGADDGFGGFNYKMDIPEDDVTVTYCLNECVSCANVAMGISDAAQVSELSMYPNPTSGSFTVFTETTSNASLSVFNMIGEEVYGVPVSTVRQVIDLSSLNEGVYLVALTTQNGISVNRLQLVK